MSWFFFLLTHPASPCLHRAFHWPPHSLRLPVLMLTHLRHRNTACRCGLGCTCCMDEAEAKSLATNNVELMEPTRTGPLPAHTPPGSAEACGKMPKSPCLAIITPSVVRKVSPPPTPPLLSSNVAAGSRG
jgi:hypothetical protein